MVTSPQDVERYAACTFFASVPSQQEENDTNAVIKTTVQFLIENEFVRLQKCDDKKRDENKENNAEKVGLREFLCGSKVLVADFIEPRM